MIAIWDIQMDFGLVYYVGVLNNLWHIWQERLKII